MSYLQFHVLFVLPPIVLLILTLKRPFSAVGRLAWLGLPLMAVVALVYTTPWDNFLVARGIWDYGEDRVLGTVGHVPVEEYAFFVLQPLLTGLWLYNLLRPRASSPFQGPRSSARRVGALLHGAASLAGVALLLAGWGPGLYLGLILAWAGPVLAGQWAYGGEVLWRARRVLLPGVAVPTVYLWIVDRTAIALGIWRVSPEHTTGASLFGLPLEEAVFFLATNLMVVQGLLLFLWVTEERRERRAPAPPPAEGQSGESRRDGPGRQPRKNDQHQRKGDDDQRSASGVDRQRAGA